MSHLLEFGPFRLDPERRLLTRNGEPVALPSKAMQTLLLLVDRRGQVVSKDDLMSAIWPDAFVEEGNLSQSIYVLRRVLGECVEDHRYIVTVPGRGYQFVARVVEVSGTSKNPDQSQIPIGTVPSPVQEPFRPNWPARFRPSFGRPLSKRMRWVGTLALVAIFFLIGGAAAIPSAARYLNNRGVRLQQEGEVKQAIAEYGRAIKLNSNYAEPHYNLADAYEEIPDYDKAVDEYQRAMDADLKFYPAYINLSRLFIMRRKDYGAALRLLDRALTLDPKEPSIRYSLQKNYGWANLELRQLGQAEQNLGAALRIDADRGAAHCLLAKTLEAEGKSTDAFKQWEACAAFSNQAEVEPEWRNQAQEMLRNEVAH